MFFGSSLPLLHSVGHYGEGSSQALSFTCLFFGCRPSRRDMVPHLGVSGKSGFRFSTELPLPVLRWVPNPGMLRKANGWHFGTHGCFAFRMSNSSLKKWRYKSCQTMNPDCHQSNPHHSRAHLLLLFNAGFRPPTGCRYTSKCLQTHQGDRKNKCIECACIL